MGWASPAYFYQLPGISRHGSRAVSVAQNHRFSSLQYLHVYSVLFHDVLCMFASLYFVMCVLIMVFMYIAVQFRTSLRLGACFRLLADCCCVSA